MSTIKTLAATLVWQRKGTGNDSWYESGCKRFSIHRTSDGRKRSLGWILFDRKRSCSMFPNNSWSRCCCTLQSAKQYAGWSQRDYPVITEGGSDV